MGQRLLVTSSTGNIYMVEDGKFNLGTTLDRYISSDIYNEYFGKVAINDDIIIVNNNNWFTVLKYNFSMNRYALYVIHTDFVDGISSISFIDNLVFITSSSHNLILAIPIEKISELINTDSTELHNGILFKLKPYYVNRLNSITATPYMYSMCLRHYKRETLESAVVSYTNKMKYIGVKICGWNVSKYAMVDGVEYVLCNYVYSTKKLPCLIVDGNIRIEFSEEYKLNDLAMDDKFIYVVGRFILSSGKTTMNRGMIIVLDKYSYKTIDMYTIQGAGELNGCVSLNNEKMNSRLSVRISDHVRKLINDGIPFMELHYG